MEFGAICLLPAVFTVVFAIMSKRTTEPLMAGALMGYGLLSWKTGEPFINLAMDKFFDIFKDPESVWMLLVCGLFGSLISVVNESNGTNAIAKVLGKICKSKTSTLLSAWILGMIIYIDDYMNILTVTSCTKKLADQRNIPREALAYVVDSTGAPTSVLIPFSTWAIFFGGVFYEQDAIKALGYGNAIATYTQIIPYIFYGIFALGIVPLFIVGVVPKIGAMKRAYERTKIDEEGYGTIENDMYHSKDKIENIENASVWDFVIPIVTMIAVQMYYDDMFIGLVASLLMCLVLYLPRKKITFNGFCDCWIEGFADLIPVLSIIVAAFYIEGAMTAIGMPAYVIHLVEPYVNAQWYPMLAFWIVGCLGFITGSNWGIPAVCAPIVIPLGFAVGANPLLVMASIVSGATLCSHACFYADATVFTSKACDIENTAHVYTQLPYAGIAMVVASVAYLAAGFLIA